MALGLVLTAAAGAFVIRASIAAALRRSARDPARAYRLVKGHK